jgi:hypothetical protein
MRDRCSKKGFSYERLGKDIKQRRRLFEIKRNISKIVYPENEKSWEDMTRDHDDRLYQYYQKRDSDYTLQLFEAYVGGFWYGNVDYKVKPGEYCGQFNDEFRERVRAYWGYKCVECGTPQAKIRLSVHHVHYDKKMCCNGSPRDVVPLCASCHLKTNFNRDYWENHFTELIYAYHPGGKCFFTKEEMGQDCGSRI